MGTMIAAYVAGWAAVTAYLGWLAVQNRRLTRRLRELHKHRPEGRAQGRVFSDAA